MTRRASDGLMQWAAVGSRISGFHHDSASKLQSLLMAVDEARELVGDAQPEVAHSLDTALTALRELHGLLTENRALAKAPIRKDTGLGELLARAALRHGVNLRGELPQSTVHVAPPSIVHALGLLCDVIAGPAKGPRTIAVESRTEGERSVIVLAGSAPAESALDAIEVATWLVEREDGRVLSAPQGFQVHLPTSARSSGANP